MRERPTFRVSTLGCRVNRADSVDIERQLFSCGFVREDTGHVPTVWVVNTCAVTGEGMRKSRKLVRKCARSGASVVATGCAVNLDPEAFDLEGVRCRLTNRRKTDIGAMVSDLAAGCRGSSWKTGGVVRVPLKVQDGCDRRCTYCIVPSLREEPRCEPAEKVVNDVRRYRHAGAREVILCGINLGAYRDPASGLDLAGMTRTVLETCGDTWIRLSSLDVCDLTDGLIELAAGENGLCPHFHLPLQSGNDDVLADMGRRTDAAGYLEAVRRIRNAIPDAGITTDIMVGFPTETEKSFSSTLEVMEEAAFSRVHIFRYSPRPGTTAYNMGDPVGKEVKKDRSARAREAGRKGSLGFHRSLVGRIIAVLVEGIPDNRKGWLFGRAGSFAGVMFKGEARLIGREVTVRITGAGARWMEGTPVKES